MGKLHIFNQQTLIAGVMSGEQISAECGYRKVVTRADVDAAVDSQRSVCRGCSDAVARLAQQEQVTIHKPEGWARLLVKAGGPTPTVKVTIGKNYARWDFPLGA